MHDALQRELVTECIMHSSAAQQATFKAQLDALNNQIATASASGLRSVEVDPAISELLPVIKHVKGYRVTYSGTSISRMITLAW